MFLIQMPRGRRDARVKRWLQAALLLALVATGSAAAAEAPCGYRLVPSKNPYHLARDRIRELLLAGRYEDLDAIELKSRDLSQRIEDGQQLRSVFFAAVGSSYVGARVCLGHKPDEMRPALEAMNARMTEKVDEWRRLDPQSRAAPIAQAMLHADRAWAARGISYASLVPDGAWPVFNTNMKQAAEVLDGLDASLKRDPAWLAERVSLAAQLDGTHGLGDVVSEALAASRDYQDLYDIGVNFTPPQWGGSDQAVARFIDSILTSASAPSQPYVTYARTAWSVADLQMFRSGRVRWEPMKRGLEQIVAEYPHPWNVNNYARFACIAADWETLRSLLPRIDPPMLAAWDDPKYEDCVRAARPRTSPWMLGGGAAAVLALSGLWVAMRRRRKA